MNYFNANDITHLFYDKNTYVRTTTNIITYNKDKHKDMKFDRQTVQHKKNDAK